MSTPLFVSTPPVLDKSFAPCHAAVAKQSIVTLDMEGVLTPESCAAASG
jgi:hypothetical protein